ncbi:hypothetical protein SCHPADRAFT_369996 [Schizopora paradoxa]|uniref:MYND-type domain-containing protein n=1 Tax=Schizopora paradoxa TaxID=27342 RepID=A0A0H2RN71_9AGAM|nr:hypothetical protein SCHPADRAFT_369996 [Schizopora paradoxa]
MSRKLPPEFNRDLSLDYSEAELSNIKRRFIYGAKAMPMMDFRLSCGLLFQSPRHIQPALYAVPFAFLNADKIPLVGNRIQKSDESMDDSERAYLSILALAGVSDFAKEIGKNRAVTEIMYKGWPGAFAWMQFWFGAITDREHELDQDPKHSEGIVDILCQALTTFLSIPRLAKLVVSTLGASILVTHLWRRGDDSELSKIKGRHLGSTVMHMMLSEEGRDSERLLVEMLVAMDGKPSAIAVTALARLRNILDGEDFTVRKLWEPLFIVEHLITGVNDAVRNALLALPCIRVVGTVLSRLLDVPFVQDDPTYRLAHRLIVLCFICFKRAMQHANGVPWVLQCLEAGFLESFVNCCPTLFAYSQNFSAEMVATFQVVSCNLAHLPVAQMAIALHKKLTKEMPVHRYINKAIPTARKAWIRFQCMVMEREEIISKLPPPSSTPVKCDFCLRLFERQELKKCAGCSLALYCSKSCQARAWKEKDHRSQCKIAKKAGPGQKGDHQAV